MKFFISPDSGRSSIPKIIRSIEQRNQIANNLIRVFNPRILSTVIGVTKHYTPQFRHITYHDIHSHILMRIANKLQLILDYIHDDEKEVNSDSDLWPYIRKLVINTTTNIIKSENRKYQNQTKITNHISKHTNPDFEQQPYVDIIISEIIDKLNSYQKDLIFSDLPSEALAKKHGRTIDAIKSARWRLRQQIKTKIADFI